MNNKKLLFGLSIFTGIGTISYWVLVFTGLFPLTEIVPGYITWFTSFPLADFWLAVTSILLAVAIKKNNPRNMILFALLTASSMIFLALNGFLFGINTGMLFMMTIDELIEIAIKVYCLTVGGYFISFVVKELKSLSIDVRKG